MAATATALAVLGIAPGGSAQPGDPAGSRRAENLGDSREAGLWKATLDDGSVLHTHGPDDPQPEVPGSKGSKASVKCVSPGQKHFEVIVAGAADDEDRLNAVVPLLRQAVYNASAHLDAEARRASPNVADVEARYPVLCDDLGELTVNKVITPTLKKDASFWTIVNDLSDAGFDSSLAKYLVFYDHCAGTGKSCSSGGQGTLNTDDRASSRNFNNLGRDYGIDYGGDGATGPQNPDWAVLLHESGHNMGAVQLSAPHSSGTTEGNGYHCNDGPDIMCYDDGGNKSDHDRTVCLVDTVGVPSMSSPFATQRFDCNGDDYFDPTPSDDSYLKNHWNLGASYNEFLYPKLEMKRGRGKRLS